MDTGYATDEAFFREVLPCLGQLRTLVMAGETLSESTLLALSNQLPRLESLETHDIGIGRASGEGIISHRNISRLKLTASRIGRLTLRCPALTELLLRDSLIFTLMPTLPSLTHLDISNCTKMPDVGLRTALLRLPTLTHLQADGVLPLTDDTLRELATQLTALQRLSIAGCNGVVLTGVRHFPCLTHLNLSRCEGLGPAAVAPCLESCMQLEEVVLDNCGQLTSLVLNMPHRLRALSLRGCRSLQHVNINARHLDTLDLAADSSPAGGGGNHALRELRITSAALPAFHCNHFTGLETVELHCPALTELAFRECDRLNGGLFTMLSDRAATPATDPNGATSTTLHTHLGGCPALHTLSIMSCDGIRGAHLIHSNLAQLDLCGCKRLSVLNLRCPALAQLKLEECELEVVQLAPVAVQSLSLGACTNLLSLQLSSATCQWLDLKGCGRLRAVELACPVLQHLDGTFCSELSEASLAAALAGQPPLQRLSLSVCCQLGAGALPPCTPLPLLTQLDLSYTNIQDLALVYANCHSLTALNVSCCRSLPPQALAPLLPPLDQPDAPPAALPRLRELNASYCALPSDAVIRLLTAGSRLETLLLNGCEGVTSALWLHLNHLPPRLARPLAESTGVDVAALPRGEALPQQPHALSTFSAVRCSQLTSCCLGLLPANGQLRTYSPRPYALQELAPAPSAERSSWVRVPTVCSGLRSLRLGLSGVQVLALALPQLAQLDLVRVDNLRELELRCPLLLTLAIHAMLLPRAALRDAVAHCASLETLNLQHMVLTGDEATELRAAAGRNLRNLLL